MIYCRYIKLTNGEDIIVTTDNDCTALPVMSHIEVVDPVKVTSVRVMRGTVTYETFMMQPWIKPAKRDIIRLPVSSILAIVSVESDIEVQYVNFITSLNKHTLSMQLEDDELDYDEDSYISEDLDEYYGQAASERTIH